jgi:hypothetical protein
MIDIMGRPGERALVVHNEKEEVDNRFLFCC